MLFKERVEKQLKAGEWELIKKFDDGKRGTNEVAHVRLKDGTDIIHKVMLAVRIAPPDGELPPLKKVTWRQRRKALYEVTSFLLDQGIMGSVVIPDLYVSSWESNKFYEAEWGKRNSEGYNRVCEVVRGYAPKYSGEEWRGTIYSGTHSLPIADNIIREKMCNSLDAQRIAVIDMLTINQDRSANNWATDGERFYAIDNGMSWFHEFPGPDNWRDGCVIDNVVIQKGTVPKQWTFISGVFATLWENEPLHEEIYEGMKSFDKKLFLDEVGKAAAILGFPKKIAQDWRFFAILKRMDWMVKNEKLPSKETYRGWLEGSEYMTPPEVVKAGGKIIWKPEWDV